MQKNVNLTLLRLLGDEKPNDTGNMAEIVFFLGFILFVFLEGEGVSKIQCLIFQLNNVNPCEIQLNIVFQTITIYMGNMKI